MDTVTSPNLPISLGTLSIPWVHFWNNIVAQPQVARGILDALEYPSLISTCSERCEALCVPHHSSMVVVQGFFGIRDDPTLYRLLAFHCLGGRVFQPLFLANPWECLPSLVHSLGRKSHQEKPLLP